MELEIGGRDRDRTCDLIHAMDALSQLSYTPVTVQNKLLMVWRTANILTNISGKFHWDAGLLWQRRRLNGNSLCGVD
jgi:hypothetical protein